MSVKSVGTGIVNGMVFAAIGWGVQKFFHSDLAPVFRDTPIVVWFVSGFVLAQVTRNKGPLALLVGRFLMPGIVGAVGYGLSALSNWLFNTSLNPWWPTFAGYVLGLLIDGDTPPAGFSWKKYESAKGRFSINFPDRLPAEEQSTTLPVGQLNLEMTMHSCDLSGLVFAVMHADCPEGLDPVALRNHLINSQVQQFSGSIENDQVVDFLSRKARLVTIKGTLNADPATIVIRAFLDKQRVYLLIWMGINVPMDPKESAHFIESFQLFSA